MANLLGLIFVVFIIGFGVFACWAIAANGASKTPSVDTFGNTPSPQDVIQNNQSSKLATSTMPVLAVVFIISVCVVIVSTVMWLWKTGNRNTGKSGY
jgi:hypothetical protein